MTTLIRTIAALTIAAGAFIGTPIAHSLPGDDNHDGVIMEDESGWDCATMGNLVCGDSVTR